MKGCRGLKLSAAFLFFFPSKINCIMKASILPVLLLFSTLYLSISCSPVKIPQDASLVNQVPSTYPDYAQSAIPFNIAPLNFRIQENGDKFITVARSRTGKTLTAEGKDIHWEIDSWHELLKDCRNDTLYMDVYIFGAGRWNRYTPIKCYVAMEAIDTYLSYRLIEPSYVLYENISINQRNLTNFEEQVIFNNGRPVEDSRGKCINCHSYQDYNRTGRMQFHMREYKGGTLIAEGKEVKKINLKTSKLISAGVYPSWHPKLNLIAYSTNVTRQHFHSKSPQKVEVIDLASDLILYDVDRNEVTTICNDSNALETFPSWSPDGKFLYYASASYPNGIKHDEETMFAHYKEIHYDIYRRAFDASKHTFSAPDTLFSASKIGKSATFPRISPDGHYLLFTMGDYGTFHIWHKSSDLYLMNLATKETVPLKEANSPEAESYHSWSSNGAWIVFSSRRDDGSYTRPYICYFKNGKASRPFILPQENPRYYKNLFKSFNVPEFMVKPVEVSRGEWVKAAEAPAKQAVYRP